MSDKSRVYSFPSPRTPEIILPFPEQRQEPYGRLIQEIREEIMEKFFLPDRFLHG